MSFGRTSLISKGPVQTAMIAIQRRERDLFKDGWQTKGL